MTSEMIVNTAQGSIVDVPGLQVGHFTLSERLTGCSVVLAPEGAVGAVDVRGAAPGTRETDLLDPANLVDKVHAVLLSGGSAFGLDAASGVVRWLEEHSIGFETGYGRVPIVPAAVLFDLPVVRPGENPKARPGPDAGYAACEAATRQMPDAGNVGAGAGAAMPVCVWALGWWVLWSLAMPWAMSSIPLQDKYWQVRARPTANNCSTPNAHF